VIFIDRYTYAVITASMKIACLILLAVLVASPAYSWEPDPWSRTDIALEVTWTALHLMDLNQTLQISANPDKYTEGCPVLSDHPSRHEVYRVFGIGWVVHALVAHILPRPYRNWWQIVWIGSSATSVQNNWAAGIRISF